MSIEYRAEAWVCADKKWEELDTRPYFPLDPEDKENRFQRVMHFFRQDETTMHALDAYLVERHASGKGLDGIDCGQARSAASDCSACGSRLPKPGEPLERNRRLPALGVSRRRAARLLSHAPIEGRGAMRHRRRGQRVMVRASPTGSTSRCPSFESRSCASLAPLAILGFMCGRLAHADEWIGDAGFRVPDLGGDWRQPLYVPALPSALAWVVAAAMVASGLACSLGYKTRPSALVFAATLAFVAVSDRLAAFTVSKMSPAVVLAIAAGPAGHAPRLRRLDEGPSRRERAASRCSPMASVRFLQLLPVTIYSASGIAKARGDWLSVPLVLWSHLHDSYQTALSFALASALPGWSWTLMQGLVLAFEMLAPLWFGLSRTRPYALVFGLGMHAMIGLCFGPVLWFALLMMTLLVGGYLPERLLEPLDRLASRLERADSPRP